MGCDFFASATLTLFTCFMFRAGVFWFACLFCFDMPMLVSCTLLTVMCSHSRVCLGDWVRVLCFVNCLLVSIIVSVC